jgi:molybdenum-dependent DNA-binding transcriptional regulator ModE
MTSRLPFTLTSLDGEPFEMWLHAYAARLDMSADQLAGLIGLPRGYGQVTAQPSPAQLAAVCSATGLASSAVTAMFACGPSPSPQLLRAWTPQRTTRFCAACLAEDPAQMPAAWRLPAVFFCLRHHQVLASRCPHCGREPAGLARPSQAGHCGGRDGCGGPLAAAGPPGCAGIPAARQAQEAISGCLAGIRDRAGTAASRRQSLSQLTDITLTAFHLATADDATQRSFIPGMLDARTLTTAFTLLTGQPDGQGRDRLASLASRAASGTAPAAVPESWHGASPALRTRIARARDPWLAPASRLRHATTLAVPRTPATRPPGSPDLAVTRAARLPDQIWPDWAIRLTDDNGARHDRFRSSALVALLLPHSDMPLRQITALVSGQLKRHIANYHMGKLTEGHAALRILTELAFALDAHEIPISYQRRRDLAASTTLIDDATWTAMARGAGMRASRPRHARRYLYELLTGCSLRTAPPPYQLTSADAQARYHDFTIGMPASLAGALTEHAQRVLGTRGIGDEPLEWQPPAGWVTATTWPGADPAGTDPAPVHRALLHEHTPPAQIAANLGISLDHLRQVLRYHPLPRPLRPIRRTLIPRPAPGSPPPGQQPGVLYLDPAWLREEYLTWHRSLNDIARQLGCPIETLNRFARQHGIPVRSRGSSLFIAAATAPGRHPRDLPEPLRNALTGRTARRRLHRLLVIAGHPSIPQAAQALGVTSSLLYAQVARLEHACGGPLIHRNPRRQDAGTLTPLGEQLLRQARDYLGLQPGPTHKAAQETAAG